MPRVPKGRPMLRCKTWLNKRGILAAAKEATDIGLGKVAVAVEREAKTSMKGGGKGRGSGKGTPSQPGEPPHVQSGTLRSAIASARKRVGLWLVGVMRFAWYGRVHEYGTLGKGGHHPPRPFLRPALRKVIAKVKAIFGRFALGKTAAGRRCSAEVRSWLSRQERKP